MAAKKRVRKDPNLDGLRYALMLVEVYESGVSGSARPQREVRAETAREIAGTLRKVIEAHEEPRQSYSPEKK